MSIESVSRPRGDAGPHPPIPAPPARALTVASTRYGIHT